MRRLHRFFDLFNDAFFAGRLPAACISLDRTRRARLGNYLAGRNAFGLSHNINLNSSHIERLTWLERLVVLAHEQCHQWQALFGQPSKTPNYHNREFCALAARIGIVVHRPSGRTLRVTDPFLGLCRREGIADPVPDFASGDSDQNADSGRGKLKKWSCSCDPPLNVRVAVPDFDATCNRCRRVFRLALPRGFSSLNRKTVSTHSRDSVPTPAPDRGGQS